MRYVTFSTSADTTFRLGVIHNDRVVDLRGEHASLPLRMIDLVRGGPDAWRNVADVVSRMSAPKTAVPLAEVTLHAPIPDPVKNVFCVGRNYAGHAAESARARGQEVKLPDVPMFFTKATTAVSGPFDDVPWDRAATAQLDWEAELGAIIGVKGRTISRGDALRHVFGYTVINDVTARDLQKSHGQFFKGKSLDGSCPMGPCVVTADEFGDPQAKVVSLRVNGIEKQHGETRDMIFPVDVLIESLSLGLTLEPGDVIATGTPDGVGFARTPPEFLQDGDLMETEVEGIGMLRNRIVARG